MAHPKYALISVSDKTGIAEFAQAVAEAGYTIISTGGTFKYLRSHISSGKLIPIEEITGNPESFDGRMKTISFEIESGILFDRQNPRHVRQAKELNIKPINLVVCNLYPFEENPSIENIDVGGPTMVRAAAKNYKNCLVVVDPEDYQKVSAYLKRHSRPGSQSGVNSSGNPERNGSRIESGMTEVEDDTFRQELAAKAFYHLSLYDSQIGKFLSKDQFPDEVTIAGRKSIELRYGENPHQKGFLYLSSGEYSPFKQIKGYWGRNLSLINVSDINAGILSVQFFKDPASVVIKHNTPCGIALGRSGEESLERAIQADVESAFGGVLVLNREVNLKTAQVILKFKQDKRGLIDIVAAPNIEKQALELLKGVRKSMGIYSFGNMPDPGKQKLNFKWLIGGFVLQTADTDLSLAFDKWEAVTKEKPTKKQLSQMKIAWKFATYIRSNAVMVIDKDLPMTRGIGSGQTSRFRATKIALEQAGEFTKGGILVSDSFFPFGDSVQIAANNGIGAIIQQGDSVNDKLSIDEANKAGIPMVFTHHRAFWH